LGPQGKLDELVVVVVADEDEDEDEDDEVEVVVEGAVMGTETGAEGVEGREHFPLR
jgi:hypothetical protein